MIEVAKESGLWVLTLNRPDKANSVTKAMLTTLADTVEAATAAGVAVLILTGIGKVFSAGADLDDARAGPTSATRRAGSDGCGRKPSFMTG